MTIAQSTKGPRRAAVYARVSTLEQTTENQLTELRCYVEVRGWTAREYVDEGVSGATDRRPALDALLRDARRRRFDVLVCWRLDRLGRNLRYLMTLLDTYSSAFRTLHRCRGRESGDADGCYRGRRATLFAKASVMGSQYSSHAGCS